MTGRSYSELVSKTKLGCKLIRLDVFAITISVITILISISIVSNGQIESGARGRQWRRAARWRIDGSSKLSGQPSALVQEFPIKNQANPSEATTQANIIAQKQVAKLPRYGLTTSTTTTTTSSPNDSNVNNNPLASSINGISNNDQYKCALYCSCSIIRILTGYNNQQQEKPNADKKAVNLQNKAKQQFSSGNGNQQLIRAKCESPLFSDLLSLDKRTQIIHISLPFNQDSNQSQPQPITPEKSPDFGDVSNQNDNNNSDDVSSLSSVNYSQDGSMPATTANDFRMPRLNQFNQLREIVIINLKFQVCDTEVFKRGQKLRRFQLNHNKLSRLSKSCFKHLDKLLELNLDYNQLNELESALFISLHNLKSLSIAYNQLTTLAAHQFANLTQLVSLNLIGNYFKTINLHLLDPMKDSLRMLLLSRNEIKSFVYAPNSNALDPKSSQMMNNTNSNYMAYQQQQKQMSSLFAGVLFKNIIKLNVDHNRFERIKLLQLHRFFNLKFLSLRNNLLVTIRDKAFNGLKLIELNLAHNKLQTLLKCAFCNATIKRLNLAHNNISLATTTALATLPLPLPAAASTALALQSADTKTLVPVKEENSSSINIIIEQVQPSNLLNSDNDPEILNLNHKSIRKRRDIAISPPSDLQQQQAPKNMLILSQSILGPLFNQLEYLDLSYNPMLADQLDFLLEPMLSLEYLNLAATGLDKSLPSPYLFKNLQQLRYLNLSHNTLDLIVSETIEPLIQLEILDLSHNQFIELEESLLVGLDELSTLKVLNLGQNPWLCTQCRVAPLYDWVLRSQIYNKTCVIQSAVENSNQINTDEIPSSDISDVSTDSAPPTSSISDSSDKQNMPRPKEMDSIESTNSIDSASNLLSLLDDPATLGAGHKTALSWHRLEAASQRLADSFGISNFSSPNMVVVDSEPLGGASYNLLNQQQNQQTQQAHYKTISSAQLSMIVRDFATVEDDLSINKIINLFSTSSQVDQFDINNNKGNLESLIAQTDFCIKCEFPSELRSYNLHELSMTDFRLCGDNYTKTPTDSRIGLTIAIVIILALFFIIIIVIIIYRKKSNNTYYPNDDDAFDGTKLDGDGNELSTGVKKPIFSISSSMDQENAIDGATDYSSPPMSQSFESYEEEEGDDDEEDDEDEEVEEEDEEQDNEDEEDDEEDDEELDEEDELDDDEEEADGNANIDEEIQDQSAGNEGGKRNQATIPKDKLASGSSPLAATATENLKDMKSKLGRREINTPSPSPNLTKQLQNSITPHSNSLRKNQLAQSSFERQSSLISGRPMATPDFQTPSRNSTLAKQQKQAKRSKSIQSPPNSEMSNFEHVARTGHKVKKFTNHTRPNSRANRGGESRAGSQMANSINTNNRPIRINQQQQSESSLININGNTSELSTNNKYDMSRSQQIPMAPSATTATKSIATGDETIVASSHANSIRHIQVQSGSIIATSEPEIDHLPVNVSPKGSSTLRTPIQMDQELHRPVRSKTIGPRQYPTQLTARRRFASKESPSFDLMISPPPQQHMSTQLKSVQALSAVMPVTAQPQTGSTQTPMQIMQNGPISRPPLSSNPSSSGGRKSLWASVDSQPDEMKFQRPATTTRLTNEQNPIQTSQQHQQHQFGTRSVNTSFDRSREQKDQMNNLQTSQSNTRRKFNEMNYSNNANFANVSMQTPISVASITMDEDATNFTHEEADRDLIVANNNFQLDNNDEDELDLAPEHEQLMQEYLMQTGELVGESPQQASARRLIDSTNSTMLIKEQYLGAALEARESSDNEDDEDQDLNDEEDDNHDAIHKNIKHEVAQRPSRHARLRTLHTSSYIGDNSKRVQGQHQSPSNHSALTQTSSQDLASSNNKNLS